MMKPVGLFTTLVTPTDGVIKKGTGTATLAGANSYNDMTSVEEGTLVAAHSSALGTADGTVATGTRVASGATLALRGGISVGAEALTLGDSSGTATLANLSGANSFGGNVALGGLTASIDNQAGSLTLGGSIDMGTSNLTVAGAGDTVILGGISGTNTSTGTAAPGLLFGRVSGNINITDYPTTTTVQLGPHVAKTQSGTDWPDNQTNTYWGQIYLDGSKSYSFIESIDDKIWLKIDGTVYINDATWNATTKSGLINKPTGWYDFELRMSDGGGQGYVSLNPGFQYNDNGIDNTSDADHWYPEDPGDASFFRIFSPLSPNDLIKAGSGTLTLTGDNTYVGTTTVQEGTLLIDGATSGQGNYTVQSGATLGGGGSIGLAPGNSVAFEPGSFLAPGAGIGTLEIVGDVVLDGATYLWELAGPANHDLLSVLGGLEFGMATNPTLRISADVADLFDPAGYEFVLIEYQGADPTNFPNWSIDLTNARQFQGGRVDYDTNRNLVLLTGLVVPEPATLLVWSLLAGLGIGCGWRRSRRPSC